MLKRRILLTASLAVVMVISISVFSSYSGAVQKRQMQSSDIPYGPGYPAWLSDPNNQVSVSQLTTAYAAHGLTLQLPGALVAGFNLTSIHVPDPANPFSYAIVTYSAKAITDFRYAEIVIQIMPGAQPSQSELDSAVSNSQGSFKSLTLSGMPVLLNPEANTGDSALQNQFGSMAYARFWNGGVYYQIRAYHPLTADDVLKMLARLQSVQGT